MGAIHHRRDEPQRLARAEQEIRLLRLRAADNGVPWYSLEPYLCGGWVDSFSTGNWRPYKTDPTDRDDLDDSWAVGFYDLGYALMLTGVVLWDPVGWYDTDAEILTASGWPALQGGDPDVAFDATWLFGPKDAFGNLPGSADIRADYDAGDSLPFTLWRDLDQPPDGVDSNDWTGGRTLLTFPSYTGSGGAPDFWQDGLTAQFFLGNVTPGEKMYAEMNTSGGVRAGGTAKVVDSLGFTHYAVPAGTQWDLTGTIIPYGYGQDAQD